MFMIKIKHAPNVAVNEEIPRLKILFLLLRLKIVSMALNICLI